MICNKNTFIGFIKVGYKHLFIYDEIGVPVEINPLCVLDFYTYETCQRKGYGKIMFTEMCRNENIEPRKMGYDRPSIKFINFLNKYFGLKYYVPQNNNFVVFKDYFIDEPKKRDKYDIYNNYSNNYHKDDLSLKKLKMNNDYKNINENEAYNNIKKNENIKNEKINKEYYYEQNKQEDKKEESNIKTRNFANYIYRSTSSEYGAFFHMDK